MRELQQRPLAGDWHVVGLGKAAGSMTLGAADALGNHMHSALVITKAGHVPDELGLLPNVRTVESAHPIPDARSLAAGDELYDYVRALPRSSQVLCLVSGGASSLVERLAPGVTLAQLQEFNARALRSGRDIGAINASRARLSTLKGGGLARLLAPRRTHALMVSDVPRDDPTVLASGLLHAPRTPTVPTRIVASHRDARVAAAKCARALGFEVREHRARFSGDVTMLARRFTRALLRRTARSFHVWSGESTLELPEIRGHGGRNQHLALTAALELAGQRDAALLAAGTDGVDGASEDAGALVDGDTIARGLEQGLDARASLEAADSGRYLEVCGALVYTGPTLTNVGDLVLACRTGPAT